jgi:hypothetical protein
MNAFRVGVGHATLCLALVAASSVGCAARAEEDVGGVDQGFNENGLTLAMCGTIDDWTPPEQSADGALSMDGRRWAVATQAVISSPELLVLGTKVCIDATFDATRRIDRCAVTPRPH